jgi:hypothetical protein
MNGEDLSAVEKVCLSGGEDFNGVRCGRGARDEGVRDEPAVQWAKEGPMLTRLSPEEVGERGRSLYRERIRDRVEKEHWGEFVLIDIESGDYEVDQDDVAAEERLLQRRPEAVLYLMRAGGLPAWTLGGQVR